MPDATGKKLLELLDPEQPANLRRAAATVLGEVASKDNAVSKALCAALDDPDGELRVEATKAVGKLHIDKALPQLLNRASLGGTEADAAAQAAARLGNKGIRGLQELMHKTAPGLRRRIASALAASGTAGAELFAVDSLLDTDPGLVESVGRTLVGELHALGKSQRKAVADRTLELLKPKKKSPLPAHSEAALVRLLAALGDARGEAIFWERIDKRFPAALRAEALQALGHLPPPTNPDKQERLLVCATDSDFRIAAPAMMILKTIPVSKKNAKEWLALLKGPDVASRRFAIEKLAGQDSAEFAQALLPQLGHPDKALRDEALAVLAKMEHGRQALAGQLLEADSPDEAWALARAQAKLAANYSGSLRTKVFNKASSYLESDDRRAEALLFVLREADANDLRDRLADGALSYRKKKKYPTALQYLRLLGRDPALGESLRFELAACGLKMSAKDLSPPARHADQSLQQFARLLKNPETPVLTYIQKATWLEPEDVFYLGFHFVEGQGPERDFGADVLRLLLKKAGKSKVAKDAKTKLRAAGFD
jgi:HEAT repeat protein